MLIKNLRVGLAQTKIFIQHDGTGYAAEIMPLGMPVAMIARPGELHLGIGFASKCKVHRADADRCAGFSHQVSFTRNCGYDIRALDRPLFMVDNLQAEAFPQGNGFHVTVKIPEAHLLPFGKKPPVSGDELVDLVIQGLGERVRSAAKAGWGPVEVRDRIICQRPDWTKVLTGKAFLDVTSAPFKKEAA